MVGGVFVGAGNVEAVSGESESWRKNINNDEINHNYM